MCFVKKNLYDFLSCFLELDSTPNVHSFIPMYYLTGLENFFWNKLDEEEQPLYHISLSFGLSGLGANGELKTIATESSYFYS